MPMDFTIEAWLQHVDNKMNYFGIPLLEAQNASLKRCSSFAVSVEDKGQLSLSTAAGADDHDDDGDEQDLNGAVGLDDVECVGAKRCLRDFQDCSRAMKRKVSGTAPEAFGLDTELGNQRVFVDAGPSTELVSVKGALTTAYTKAKKVQHQLPLLQQGHNELEGELRRGFYMVQGNWKIKEKLSSNR